MKHQSVIISLILPAILSIFLVSCGNDEGTSSENPSVSVQTTVAEIPQAPSRKLDLYGKIVSMEGNEVTVLETDVSKDPTFNMSPEEKQKYMQSLDEAARTALKEEINAATLGNVKVTVPVGIPMTKKTAQGPDAPTVAASLADLKVGQYLSIWYASGSEPSKSAEFVKIAFSQ